jgi:hypothetical protein
MDLPKPFDTFCVECKAGEYKDFGQSPESTYPLKGVTYPVDYGDIEGYKTEDSANLDLFVGTKNDGLRGYLVVHRPELEAGEHKFYINLSEEEEKQVIDAFNPVIIQHGRYETQQDMSNAVEIFKVKPEQS